MSRKSKKNEARPANYRKLFFLGVFCMVIGLPFGAFILIVLGSFLMIIGWVNKHKWPKVETIEVDPSKYPERPAKDPEEDYDR